MWRKTLWFYIFFDFELHQRWNLSWPNQIKEYHLNSKLNDKEKVQQQWNILCHSVMSSEVIVKIDQAQFLKSNFIAVLIVLLLLATGTLSCWISKISGFTGAPVAFKTWCGHKYRVGIICPPWLRYAQRRAWGYNGARTVPNST